MTKNSIILLICAGLMAFVAYVVLKAFIKEPVSSVNSQEYALRHKPQPLYTDEALQSGLWSAKIKTVEQCDAEIERLEFYLEEMKKLREKIMATHSKVSKYGSYRIIDYGAMYDEAIKAESINNKGQSVGHAIISGYSHATLIVYSFGVRDLGTLGGNSSSSLSINDKGQIVGVAENSSGDWRATLFGYNAKESQKDLMKAFEHGEEANHTRKEDNLDLGTLGGKESNAHSINNNGQIVGQAVTSSGDRHATLFDPNGSGENIDLGTLGGKKSFAESINNNGEIVGYAQNRSGYFRATLFETKGINTDLGALGGDWSHAYSINDEGQIVGDSMNSSGNYRATLFDPDTANIDLGTLGGHSSGASSINNNGYIVGSAEDVSGDERATLFDPTGNGNNVDLNNLIRPSAGWKLVAAWDINDNGWIIGMGINRNGEKHNYLLKPLPKDD